MQTISIIDINVQVSGHITMVFSNKLTTVLIYVLSSVVRVRLDSGLKYF